MKKSLNQIAKQIHKLDRKRKELLEEYQEAEATKYLTTRKDITRAEALQLITVYEICLPVEQLSFTTLRLFEDVRNLVIDDTDELITAVSDIEQSLLTENKSLL